MAESPLSPLTEGPLEAELVPPELPWSAGARPPVRWREIIALVALIAVADLTLYRGHGPAGIALFLVASPILLLAGTPWMLIRPSLWVVGMMLLVLAVRLVWCGTVLLFPIGLALVMAFAMSLSGQRPYVLETVVFASQTIWAGYQGLGEHWGFLTRPRSHAARLPWLNVVLPLVIAVMFSTLFLLANPDLMAVFSDKAAMLLDAIRDWLVRLSPEPLEVLFWLGVLWIGIGLLRPVMAGAVLKESSDERADRRSSAKRLPATLYPAYRNTLIVVIALFAIYLVFEFNTLWFREFPAGFHYSGYAHEGAAWLTVALALATVVLSIVFRGDVLQDPRLAVLQRLAWLWSLQNLLLGVAVYNRLFIYVGFNGMTRMRTVGLFGISAVVVGFLLVVWKIARNRNFVWLIRRHLWTVTIAIYLLAITPVDTIVVRYNVQRILRGDPAPSVQISVHPISAEGISLLLPLLECEDAIIREGIRAMLAERLKQAEAAAERNQQLGWTTYQIADQVVLQRLRAARQQWAVYDDDRQRAGALKRFHDYAYQWY